MSNQDTPPKAVSSNSSPVNPDTLYIKSNNEHYEVGRQIHVDTYYYVRHFFEENLIHKEDTIIKFAKVLLDICQNMTSFTIAGVGSYLGSFIQKSIDKLNELLNQNGQSSISGNYCLLNNSEKKLSFLFQPTFKSNTIILLPITCTFKRGFEVTSFIQNYIATHNKMCKNYESPINTKIFKEFISVFLISDRLLDITNIAPADSLKLNELLNNQSANINQPIINIARLYSSFGWSSIDNQKIRFESSEIYKGYSARFLKILDSNLYLGENCPYCFPVNLTEERPLIPTKNNHDSPHIITSLPSFYNEEGIICTHDFQTTLFRNRYPGHLFGHLKIRDNSFLHYIERDTFYKNNQEHILSFFTRELKKILHDITDKKEILVIYLTHQQTSTILDDLFKESTFPNIKFSFRQVNLQNEYIENIFDEQQENLSNYSHIFFFDYVISNGNTFKLIHDFIQSVSKNNKGVSTVLTVIDRTTALSKKEILKKIPTGANGFITYLKINVPLTDAVKSGNPIEERVLKLEGLFATCHLDYLKIQIKQELLKAQPLNLDELKASNHKYSSIKKERNLLKLDISNRFSIWLHQNISNLCETGRFTSNDLSAFIDCIVKDYEKIGLPFRLSSLEIKDLVVKTLSQSPFSFYQDIYKAVFHYTIQHLDKIVSEIIENDYIIKNSLQLDAFVFYTNRSVHLNSSYILSPRFIKLLKKILTESKKDTYPITIDISKFARLYKDLNFKNPIRAIKLEELINESDILPEPIREKSIRLQETLEDRFYQFGRLVKSENIYLIKQLKDLFLSEALDKSNVLTSFGNDPNLKATIRLRYLSPEADKTNPVIRNIHTFLKNSKHKTTDPTKFTTDDITCSLESMLVASLNIRTLTHSNDFIKEIKTVLNEVISIIGPGLKYTFCIEFKEKSSPTTYADNIYTISSDKHEKNFQIHQEGLIYEMLHGLFDPKYKSLQTFIAVAQNETGEFISFSDHYLSSLKKGHSVVINDAIKIDIKKPGYEVLDEKTQMALIFRLAEIPLDPELNHKGQAILIITSDEKANTETFTNFINVEKVRLLLLIKSELLQYLRRQFENDSFIELLKQRKINSYKNSMAHMLTGYFKAMSFLLEKDKSIDESDIILLKFLRKKIYRHIQSISSGGTHDLALNSENTVEYNSLQLRGIFDTIMQIPYLSQFEIEDPPLNIDTGTFRCPIVIFEQIIPELIINMKRNACTLDETQFDFRISVKEGVLIFTNSYNTIYSTPTPEDKPNGGLEMCNNILAALGLPPLQKSFNGIEYSITLTLTKKYETQKDTNN